MDSNTQAVLVFLGAIYSAQERLSSLSWFDERLHSPWPYRDGKYRPLTASGRADFNGGAERIGHKATGGITIRAYCNLRWVEAFYNNDRVESLIWQIELDWNDSSFVIDSRIVACTDNKYYAETDLFTLPDRLASTVEECQQELAQATEDLLRQRDIIYTLLRKAD